MPGRTKRAGPLLESEDDPLPPTDWTTLARAGGPYRRVRIPVTVLADEAVAVVRFLQAHWAPRHDDRGSVIEPGLERAGLPAGIGEEIAQLQQALLRADAQVRFQRSPSQADPMARATFVLREIVQTSSYVVGLGGDPQDVERLTRLRAAHRRPVSQDALACALDEYAAFAELHRHELAGVGGFDASLVDEAPRLARELRDISARRASRAGRPRSDAVDLRNRLAVLLHDRLRAVRTAARFVFRDSPETARRATSAYERARRARRRSVRATNAT